MTRLHDTININTTYYCKLFIRDAAGVRNQRGKTTRFATESAGPGAGGGGGGGSDGNVD